MKRIVILLWLIGTAAFGQAGFPYSTGTTNADWETFVQDWKPILSWYSGLVWRAEMLGVAGPSVDQVRSVPTQLTNTLTVTNGITYTNTAISAFISVTNRGLQPTNYTLYVNGVGTSVPVYPLLTRDLITDLDTFQDGLYHQFVSMSVTGSLGDYSDAMNRSLDPNFLWVPLTNFPETKARTFDFYGIGKATNFSTNVYQWVTNGLAYWTAPLRGFSGDFRLGSVNAEPYYSASNFPVTNGIDFAGSYYWLDPARVVSFDEEEWFPGAWIKDRAGPVWFAPGEWDDLAEVGRCMFTRDATRDYLVTCDLDYYWPWWPAYPDEFYGYTRRRNSTNWFPYTGGTIGSSNVPGGITEGLAWNYRRGPSWVEIPVWPNYIAAPGDSWFIDQAAVALRYSRTNAVYSTNVSVSIYGRAFPDTIATLGTVETSTTVAVSGALTAVPVKFAGVTNITATGDLAAGDAITLVWTNRTGYCPSAETWGTINKTSLDERIKAVKPLQFTAREPSFASETSLFWSAQSGYFSDQVSAYNDAVSKLQPTNNLGESLPGPIGEYFSGEGNWGAYVMGFVSSPPQYFCNITVQRKYGQFYFNSIPSAIPHEMDVLINAYEAPTNRFSVPGQTAFYEFYCDLPGYSTRGVSWIYTNFPAAITNTRIVTLRGINTNHPVEGVDFPYYDSSYDLYWKGFQAPSIQAVLKWQSEY